MQNQYFLLSRRIQNENRINKTVLRGLFSFVSTSKSHILYRGAMVNISFLTPCDFLWYSLTHVVFFRNHITLYFAQRILMCLRPSIHVGGLIYYFKFSTWCAKYFRVRTQLQHVSVTVKGTQFKKYILIMALNQEFTLFLT